MEINGVHLERINENLWEIPRHGNMRVPGRIYLSQRMIKKYPQNDESLKQVINVAHLPGIQKYSLAMPDIHWGYGFPIGGVAATDLKEGVISPGGVGYDINCGVRAAATDLRYSEIKDDVKKLTENLFKNIPCGVGASGAIQKLHKKDVLDILNTGANWAVEHGFGVPRDLEFTEENGRLKLADANCVSPRAIERGLDQAGTLGSGNHFLEIDVVDEIFDENIAGQFGLFADQIVIQIHSGSRGLGYQVCDDYLKKLMKFKNKLGFELPDLQLICAPLNSEPGREYLAAMSAAANFAWNNRQIMMHLCRKTMRETLSISERQLNFKLIYDVCHNIAKIETHRIDGKPKEVCVHRKGATRAFPAGDKNLPEQYRNVGQPVLIPGDMGRYSFIAVGGSRAMEETFGSSCHGAGRVQSRKKALQSGKGINLMEEMNRRGVEVRARGMRTLAEEMPQAYKDVADVMEVMHRSGISAKVARLKPLGVIKG